jgi:hypothetical protein|tara:strand:- start:1002 stop:1370 length:369 start_codon:yes stop_codon:yes gene_type:complete
MKNKVMIIGLGILMVVANSSIFAHGKNLHGKPSSEVRHEVRAELKNKTVSETWGFVDHTIKDLAKELQATNYKQSKQELVRLKKSLDILKKKIATEKKEERSHEMKKGHEGAHHEHNMEAAK